MRCLIADDVSILRRIIENIIKPYFETVIAENGEQAFELFEHSVKMNKPFDVVFLDILMPKLNGIQALQKMRHCEVSHSTEKRSKIIMITGLNDQNSVKQALSEGCDGYILKPYSQDNVLNAIKKQGINIEKLTPTRNQSERNREESKERPKAPAPADFVNQK